MGGRRRRRPRVRGHAVRAQRRAERAPRLLRAGGVWVKDETGNVSGSHKARHLMGLMVHLLVVGERARARRSARSRPPGHRELRERGARRGGRGAAPPAGRSRSSSRPTPTRGSSTGCEALGAQVDRLCPRDAGASRATPRTTASRRPSRAGAIPFTVQGNENGLAIEGGLTLAYEMAAGCERGRHVDRPRRRPGRRRRARRARAPRASRRRRRSASRKPAPPATRSRREGGGSVGRVRTGRCANGSTPSPSTPLEAHVRFAATHRSAFMWPWETGAAEHRPRHPRRRDLRLAGRGDRDVRDRRATPSWWTRQR